MLRLSVMNLRLLRQWPDFRVRIKTNFDTPYHHPRHCTVRPPGHFPVPFVGSVSAFAAVVIRIAHALPHKKCRALGGGKSAASGGARYVGGRLG